MTKIQAMNEVLKGKGKVYAESPNGLGNKITYGAGDSLRWNFGSEFVSCDYLNRTGWVIVNKQ